MNSEVSEAIQIIEFTGRGVGVIFRASKASMEGGWKIAKGVGKGSIKAAKWTALQIMQAKLRLHFADKGTNSSLSLRDMERLTGGNYGIVKIPLERGMGWAGDRDIKRFFDGLKTLKIPFSELPDLHRGDGFIELAYNPQDSGKLKDFLNGYKFSQANQPKDITLEEYMSNATPEGEKELQEMAVKNAKKEMEEKEKQRPKESGKKKSLDAESAAKRSRENIERLKKDVNKRHFFGPSRRTAFFRTEDVIYETKNGYILKLQKNENEERTFVGVRKKKCSAERGGIQVEVEKAEEFEILDRSGKVISRMQGDDLYHRNQNIVSQKPGIVRGKKDPVGQRPQKVANMPLATALPLRR